jgi:hypothetical protein
MPKNSPIKKIKMLLSSLTERLRLSKAAFQPGAIESSSPVKLLTKCSEVNMGQFIACLCDDDLSQLIISGEPTALEIAQAWANLFFEYCELAEDAETAYRVRLDAQLTLDRKKEELGQGWVRLLEQRYSAKLAEALQMIGFEYELNPEDPEQFKSDIRRINGELGYLRLTIKIKEAEWRALKEKQSTTDTVDRKYFSTIFFAINNYAKREAVNMQTTVENYCAGLRAMADAVSHNK